ncbi:hypothetical protein CsatB_010799 [Cannabis sativa]|uniref:S-acyltransferase n=2 Tax=Cannabis sativa TaxID=3483 RepID=A0AB40ECC1_CANSA|nr:hypothetical protein G4B88_013797 [Cannabis sativa]
MQINVFTLCSGLKFLGYLMILLVAAIIAVSYYAVVVFICGNQLLRGGLHSFFGFSVIIIFHALLILLLWSYFRVVFKNPGTVPENWKPSVEEDNLQASTHPTHSDQVAPDASSSTQSLDGIERRQPGYCTRCQIGKPPRCHHCSVCQRCVLKMDHHCIWVVNCVGAQNYKFFLLFLLYTFLETTLDTLVLLPHFVKFFGDAKNRSTSAGNLAIVFTAFVLNLAFSLSLLCFIIMHASLVSSNTTSVEVYEKKRAVRWQYDLGKKRNFEQVFGKKKALWFFPLFSKDDLDNIPALEGLEFPTRADVEV